MAYTRDDAYRAMQKIYGYKQDWMSADAAGDTTKRNNAATKAQEYYRPLTDNGYGDVANKLSASGLDQSRKYIDNWYAAAGRQQTRPYLYGKGQKYGLTQSDIDKALSFNETTGEVSLGGKNIGKPAAISSDGYSYYDSDTLDKAWEDYVKTTGATESLGNIAKQGTSDLMGMNKQLFDATMKDHDTINGTNPLDTAVGKAIMQKYGLMGYTGRQNALANGAASNGGNVDSYSAANAMRQQVALNSMGVDAALNAYNSQVQNAGTRLDQARATLQQMGVNINDAVANNETMLNGEVDRSEKLAQGKFDREQTARNNAVDNYVKMGSLTGYVPEEATYDNNPYLDSNGNVINPEQYDFADMIAKQQDLLANATDENDKASIRQNIEWLRQAGRQKVLMPQYSQYASNWAATQPMGSTRQRTEEGAFGREQLASSERMTTAGYEHEKDMANLNAENERKQSELDAELEMKVNNNNTNNTIRANAAASSGGGSGKTSGTGGTSGTSGTTSIGGKDASGNVKLPSGYGVSDWVEFLNADSQKKYNMDVITQTSLGAYKTDDRLAEHVVHTILTNSDMTYEQKEYVLSKLGVSNLDELIDRVRSDSHYR